MDLTKVALKSERHMRKIKDVKVVPISLILKTIKWSSDAYGVLLICVNTLSFTGHQRGDRARSSRDGSSHAYGLSKCHSARHAVQVDAQTCPLVSLHLSHFNTLLKNVF